MRDIVFVADRSLSPSGILRLKNHRLSQSPWPNPLVYGALEWTERAQKKLWIKAEPLEKIGTGLELLVHAMSKTPTEAWELWKKQKLIWPLGLSLDSAHGLRELLSRLAELDAPIWSDIFWAHALLRATGRRHSPWQATEELIARLAGHPVNAAEWAHLCGASSEFEELRIQVRLTRELWPLERKLLDVVPCPVDWMESREGTFDFGQLSEVDQVPSSSALHWIESGPSPGPLQWWARLPEGSAIDLEFRSLASDNLPALILRWLQGQKLLDSEEQQIESWGWPVSKAREWITETLGFSSEEWATEGKLLQWLPVVVEALAPTKSLEPRLDAFHPTGVAALSLDDLAWGLGNPLCLVGDLSQLKELCRPHSPASEARAVFPSWLRSEIEKLCSIAVPDPAREALWLSGWMAEHQSKIHYLRAPVAPSKLIVPEPDSKGPSYTRPLSASTLKNYSQCPRSFLWGQLLRLSPNPEPDADRINPAVYGNWVHAVLEKTPTKELQSPEWFQDQLHQALENYFDAKLASPEYRELLKLVGSRDALSLHRWFENFEVPLHGLIQPHEQHREQNLQIEWRGHAIAARLDRVDQTRDELFVWDYKTGSIPTGAWEKLVEQGHPQLPLYKALSETHWATKLSACGFLNPLNPSKSKIFVFSNQDAILKLCEKMSIPVEQVGTESAKIGEDSLMSAVEAATKGLAEGFYGAQPQDPKQCDRCYQSGLCGRPFLVQELEP